MAAEKPVRPARTLSRYPLLLQSPEVPAIAVMNSRLTAASVIGKGNGNVEANNRSALAFIALILSKQRRTGDRIRPTLRPLPDGLVEASFMAVNDAFMRPIAPAVNMRRLW